MSFDTIVELPTCDITERARPAFKAWGSMPRLQAHHKRTRGGSQEESEGERKRQQQSNTPERERSVLYHVVPAGESTRHGLRAPAPEAAMRATLDGQLIVNKNGYTNKFSIVLTTCETLGFTDSTKGKTK